MYKIKPIADNGHFRYKARLVLMGFTQRESVNYTDNETFSLVAKFASIRAILVMSARTIFLHDDLIEEIYMNQPDFSDGTGRFTKQSTDLSNLQDAGTLRL